MHSEKYAAHQLTDSEAKGIAAEWLSSNRLISDALVLSIRRDAAQRDVFRLQLWLSLFRSLETELEKQLMREAQVSRRARNRKVAL